MVALSGARATAPGEAPSGIVPNSQSREHLGWTCAYVNLHQRMSGTTRDIQSWLRGMVRQRAGLLANRDRFDSSCGQIHPRHGIAACIGGKEGFVIGTEHKCD